MRAQIDIPERDRHVRTYVHCENRSLIQSLTLMRLATTGFGLEELVPSIYIQHSAQIISIPRAVLSTGLDIP